MTLALEVNDAALVLANAADVLAAEPGIAMLDGTEPETGTAAARRARLQPLFAESRYWQDLSDEALPRRMPAASTPAEAAYAQLKALVGPWLAERPELLLAVPPWYTREQLGLLLGIVEELGLKAVGLVDASLASASLSAAPANLMQLELWLHRSVLSVLEHSGELRRTRFEVLPQHGWLALQQAWLEMLAATFVRKTRFDPLHDARTEQLLCDGLPGWLAALAGEPAVTIEIAAEAGVHAVELGAAQFEAAAQSVYQGYVNTLQQARAASGPLHLRVSQRFAILPGFLERLAEIRDCEIQVLPRGAAALGALAWESAIRREAGALALVQRLPVEPLAVAGTVSPRGASVPAAQRPTHLAYHGRAYRIAADPLLVGCAPAGGARVLTVEAGPGISRQHCALWTAGDGVWLEDRSTYGTWLNDQRIGGRVPLREGDRLRIGSPGTELLLLREVDERGAP